MVVRTRTTDILHICALQPSHHFVQVLSHCMASVIVQSCVEGKGFANGYFVLLCFTYGNSYVSVEDMQHAVLHPLR